MNYTVLDRLNHNQVEYNAGDSIDLSPEVAAPLLEVKAIGESGTESTPSTEPEPEQPKTRRKPA